MASSAPMAEHCSMNNPAEMHLTEADYDALYEALRKHLPVTRSEFPATLARVIARGIVSIMSTDREILLLMGSAPKHWACPIQRKHTLH
jgi:hypothetical protein